MGQRMDFFKTDLSKIGFHFDHVGSFSSHMQKSSRTQSVPLLKGLFPLRGGGCKAKHLSQVKGGRRIMVGKHAFPSLQLGSEYGQVAAARNATTASALALPITPACDDGDEDMALAEPQDPSETDSVDSYSSDEAAAAYRLIQRRAGSAREPPPPAGLIPLTGLGQRRYGAISLAQSYRGRPIKVHRAPRPPADGDVFAWGDNYDGQVPHPSHPSHPRRTPPHPRPSPAPSPTPGVREGQGD